MGVNVLGFDDESSDRRRTTVLAPADTVDLPLPHPEDQPTPYEPGGVSLDLPDNITYEVVYDPETGNYNIVQNWGAIWTSDPSPP